MSAFSDAMNRWVDPDNMIGNQVNPSKWTSGNGLLETAIAIAMEIELNGSRSDVNFLMRLIDGINSCKVEGASFNKNPGRLDQITHDDLIAVAATQRIASTSFATHIVKYGQRNGWDLSNNGQTYWDAQAKPWEIAYYEMAAGQSTSMYNLFALACEIGSSAFVNLLKKGSASGDRLMWLKLLALKGRSHYIDLIAAGWRVSARKKYGNVGNMMRSYYNSDDHPYVIFGQDLTF